MNPIQLSFNLPESISVTRTAVSACNGSSYSPRILNSSSTCSSEFCGRTTSTSPGAHSMPVLSKLISRTSWKCSSAVVLVLLCNIFLIENETATWNEFNSTTHNDWGTECRLIENRIHIILIEIYTFAWRMRCPIVPFNVPAKHSRRLVQFDESIRDRLQLKQFTPQICQPGHIDRTRSQIMLVITQPQRNDLSGAKLLQPLIQSFRNKIELTVARVTHSQHRIVQRAQRVHREAFP